MGEEWVYVLEGSLTDDRGVCKKGHFFKNEKGSAHTVVSGPEGCVILVVWCGRIVKD